MKVLLLENVEDLGAAGDVVDVAEGYARNRLFPSGLAAQATEQRVREAAERRADREAQSRMTFEETQRHVVALDGKTIPLTMTAGPEGKLFGAVTARRVSEEIERALSITLPKGAVKLVSPITQVGETPVRIEFPHGLEADIIVVVTAEKSPGGGAKEKHARANRT